MFFFLDCLTTFHNSNTCSEDDAIFHCIVHDNSVTSWRITSTCESMDYITSFSATSSIGETRNGTLCSTTLVFTVTSLTSSSISVPLTIHTPVLLNGTRISCEGQSQTLKLLPSEFTVHLFT